jgi:hypothetical protein
VANPNQDARHQTTGRYVRTPQTAERDAEAARLKGLGWTLTMIAAELGYGHRSSVAEAIDRAYRDIAEPARAGRDKRARQLDMLWEYAQEILDREHITVSNGKVITLPDPETGEEKPLRDDGPALQAITEMRRINESYRKLEGDDRPAKMEVSGGVKYEVVGVDPEDLT